MEYCIYYGNNNKKIDVTEICLNKLKKGKTILIPFNDLTRADYFGDPDYGNYKNIYIKGDCIDCCFDHRYMIIINIETGKIGAENNNIIENIVKDRLLSYHSRLNINFGDFSE